MSEVPQALGIVAPWYNLAMVAVVIILFIHLFRTHRKTHLGHIKPWVLLFVAVLVYVAEAVFTVLRSSQVFDLPHHVNGYFELVMIALFIYALLSEKEYLRLREEWQNLPIAQSKKASAPSKKVSPKAANKAGKKKR